LKADESLLDGEKGKGNSKVGEKFAANSEPGISKLKETNSSGIDYLEYV
jgi:hypothetical protein